MEKHLKQKDFNEIEFFNGNYETIFQNQIYYYEKFDKDYSNYDRLLSEVDLNTWLIDHALALWDKAGMAHSIEIRVPFLDLELKNNILKIPDKIRFSKIGKKLLLRQTFESKLPEEIINFLKKDLVYLSEIGLHLMKIKIFLKKYIFRYQKEFSKNNFYMISIIVLKNVFQRKLQSLDYYLFK